MIERFGSAGYLHYVTKFVRNLRGCQNTPSDQFLCLKRLESVHDRIIDRAGITLIDLGTQSDSGCNKLAGVVPLILPCGCTLRVICADSNGDNETRMMRVHVPLCAANVRRQKLGFPFLITRFVLNIDGFSNTAAGRRSRVTAARGRSRSPLSKIPYSQSIQAALRLWRPPRLNTL